jgi:hypothetical protein
MDRPVLDMTQIVGVFSFHTTFSMGRANGNGDAARSIGHSSVPFDWLTMWRVSFRFQLRARPALRRSKRRLSHVLSFP